MANNNVPCEVHDRVYGWCKSSLGGAWATVTKDEFLISPLRGGLTNYMYLCSLPNHKVTKRGETRQLLVRIYGHVAKSMEFILSNSVLFSILAERKLGPKLFGVFPEGRIEEYLPARQLKTKQLSNPEISEQVATKLAQFHSLRVPLNKNPTWFFTHVERWIEESLVLIKSCKKLTLDEKLNKYMSFDLVAEYGELKKLLLSVNSPILFCHNDLQEGNILYDDNCPDPERRMTFIDLDYCNYNFRGFDFGNHMIEWCYDYTYDQPPFFTYTPSSYPTWEQKCRFFRAYIKSQDESRDVTELELSQLSWETDMFALGSSFFWGVWSIVQAAKSEITFDYVEFAISRFDHYFTSKGELMKRCPPASQ